jgi:serine/threonine protein phosphatase PrpC
MLILHKSIQNRGKTRNGDACKIFEDSDFFLGCVADGVGSRPCDYTGSKQVCDDFVRFFQSESKHCATKDRLANSLRHTFEKLYNTQGACAGMLSTFVCLLLDKTTNAYYSICLGDSKILEIQESDIRELSVETEFELKPAALAALVTAHGKITDQIGFALMSDGFYGNRKSYQTDLAYLLRTSMTEAYFDQIMALYQKTQFDDMTLMIVKLRSE